jgi:hypothetical protein
MAFRYSPKIVTDGLVLYLDAANIKSYVSGSTLWNDLTINSNNGVLTNGPTFSSSNAGYLIFDGTNDYVDTNINMSGYTDFTLSMYAKTLDTWPISGTTFRALCGNTGGGSYVRMNINPTSVNVLFFANGPGTFMQTEVFNTSNNINDWYHYTFTRSTTFQRIYLNGVLKSEVTFSNVTSLTNYYRAVGTYATSYLWNGYISDYRIYNRALSSTEVLQNYNALKARFGLT